MTKRKLAPEEIDLWRRVADRTERLDLGRGFDPDVTVPTPPKPAASKHRTRVQGSVFPPKPAPRATSKDLVPSVPDRMKSAPVNMDRKAYGRMKRGKLSPEGRIDLHGMTLERAHPALTRFILSAHAQGKRLVLVITGKGKQRDTGGPIPVRHGVLRHQVPQWLSMAPLSSAVLQISEAHISHGGGGAYYVYLRRSR